MEHGHSRCERRKQPVVLGRATLQRGSFLLRCLGLCFVPVLVPCRSSQLRWPMLAVMALSVVLSWRDASWLTTLFLDHVPLFSKFRDTKMMLVLAQMIVPLGAAMALHEMSQPEAAKRWKRWVAGSGAAVLIFLAFYAMPKPSSTSRAPFARTWPSSKWQARVGMRIDVFRSDVLRALGFAVLGLLASVAGEAVGARPMGGAWCCRSRWLGHDECQRSVPQQRQLRVQNGQALPI